MDPVEAIDTLARTCYGEARNQGRVGMAAVASVVLNRVRVGGWWGHDVVSVCRRKFQFSCWLPSDPNLAKLLAVTEADAEFRIAISLAQLAMVGNLADPTGGATYYFEAHIQPPPWAKAMTQTCQIGAHKFFRPSGPTVIAATQAPEAHSHG